MSRPRAILLALSLGACTTTPALPEIPPDHPAHADAQESASPPRTPTLDAAPAEPDRQAASPAPTPSRASDHGDGSHR